MQFPTFFALLSFLPTTLASDPARIPARDGIAPVSGLLGRGANLFLRQSYDTCGDGTSCISSFCCGSSACVVDLRQCCKNGQVCLPGETCMIDSVGVFCKNTAGGTVSAKSSTAVKTTISTTQTATAKTTAVVTNTAKTTATASVTGPATTATSVVSVPASTVTAANQPVATVIKGGGANREGVSLSVVLAGVAAMALF